MNSPSPKDSPRNRLAMYLNYACTILVFGSILAIKIYIVSTGDDG